MANEVPTVKVQHDDGYAVINAADFDPAVHVAYVESETPAAPVDPKAGESTGGDAATDAPTQDAPSGDVMPPSLAAMSAKDACAFVSVQTDVVLLQALDAADDRKTVKAAIADRLASLSAQA